MKRLLLLAAALSSLASAARAQTTAPTCGVARDPQLVTAGTLHVLDRTASKVLRWSLVEGRQRAALSIGAGAVAFAYLPARNALVIEHSDPPRLTLRSLADRASEQPFATLPGEPCGLAASESQVVACFSHDQYRVLDAGGHTLDEATVGEADATTHSWDGMVWDGVTRTLFAARTQGDLLGVLALPIDTDGVLGEPEIVEPDDPNVARSSDTGLSLLPDGSRAIAPDGLIVGTDPLALLALPGDPGDAFAIGDDVFGVGEALDSACALTSADGELAPDARISSGEVRAARWGSSEWLLRGSGASAKLQKLRPGSGDLDGDRAPDEVDVFPLDPVTARDWDHDGVDDEHDAAPTDAGDWQDSDGDKVGDNADAFPDDPAEWADSDDDGVGDKADAFPDDPDESVDSDSDGVGDNTDVFPFDPLEQSDFDEDGVSDRGDAFPDDPGEQGIPLGAPSEVFDLAELKRGARLSTFTPSATVNSAQLALYDDGRFSLTTEFGEPLVGTFEGLGHGGKKFALRFDVQSLSRLEEEFALEAEAILANDDSDPPPPELTFYPKSVASSGTLKRTKKGVTLSLRVTFAFQRDERGAPGSKGAFVYRAKGVAAGM